MKQKNKVFIQLLITVLILLLTAFATIADDKKPDVDKVATVNGTIITREQLNNELQQVKQRILQQGQEVSEVQLFTIRTKILENLISRELLYQESRNKGIKIDPQTAEAQLEGLKQRFPNEAEFKKALSQINLSEETLQIKIERDLAIQELVNSQIVPQIKISNEENRAFYNDHPEYFKQPEQVKASHILIKLDPQSEESQQQQGKKREARQLLDEIAVQNGFELLACEVMPDHVHLFVSAPPKYSPSTLAKLFKGITSRRLRQELGIQIRRKVWKPGTLWSPSYYVGTAGNVSGDVIKDEEAEMRAILARQ